jgi:hypothetical protein
LGKRLFFNKMAACGRAEYGQDCENRVDLRFVNALSNHTSSSDVNRRFLEVTILGENKKSKAKRPKDGRKLKQKQLRFDIGSLETKATSRCSPRKIYELDRNPTTHFDTHTSPRSSKPEYGFVNALALENLPSADDQKQVILPEVLVMVDSEKSDLDQDVVIGELGRRDTLVRSMTGEVISKKLATQEELDGAIIAHVYFTTARSGKWPPFIISVPKDYNFMKLMRKAIAGMQKTIRKGERPSHDWLFKYHVNRQIPKMRSELKVLFGRKKVEFRGTNLNKGLESAKLDPVVNRFWILPKKSKH